MNCISECYRRRCLYLVAVIILITAVGYKLYLSQSIFCTAQLDLIMIRNKCIIIMWKAKENCKGEIQPFDLRVHNGNRLYNVSISNGQLREMQGAISKLYCVPYCTVCTDDVLRPCLIYSGSKTKHNLKDHQFRVDPSNGSCIPVVSLNASCKSESEFETFSYEEEIYKPCLHRLDNHQPVECIDYHTCFGDKKIITILLLVQKCSYHTNSQFIKDLKARASTDYIQFLDRYSNFIDIGSISTLCPSHDQECLSQKSCPPEFEQLKLTPVNKTQGYDVNQLMCHPSLVEPKESTIGELTCDIPHANDSDLINDQGRCAMKSLNFQTTWVHMALTLLSSFLAMLVVHKQQSLHYIHFHLFGLIVLSGRMHSIQVNYTFNIAAIQFGESDVFVREGMVPRPIVIQRQDTSHPLGIKVYSTTVEDYKQHYDQMGCNLTLDEIGIQESQMDPAEDTDLKRFEYELTFEADIREVSINLDVYDDQLAEKEEWFIVYLNYSELPTDQCALAVRIIDNDWLMFNFSTNQVIIDENVGKYFNLSIIKTGQNEPNVTVEIAVTELLRDIKGTDFDLLETHYVFDNETIEQSVHIIAYDDPILEAEETFLLYFPSLSSSDDVQLISETAPNRVTVTIQDNEVAVVGFTTEGDVMLQEGGGSARICAGFDSDIDGITIDNEVFFILTIIDLSPIHPGTGHDLILEPSATLYMDTFGQNDCLDVSSAYDTNLNESKHVLSLQIRHMSVTLKNVIFSRQYLSVYITDYHGLVFTLQPSNVTTGVRMEAHFNCDYAGTHASPIWKITHPKGTSRMVSTARLPHNHFSTDTGLVIKDVNETHNMTSYACLFRIYDRDQIVTISSTAGTLIVLEMISFDLQLTDSNNNIILLSSSSRTLELFKGDNIPSVTIKKFGYSEDTFIVIMRIKTLNSDHYFTPQISWYAFDRHTYEHTLPMFDDDIPHSTKYLVEIISPVSSIEMSNTHVVVSEPILICFFDKDYTVGFTTESVILHEGVRKQICFTAYDHKIHPSTNLNFTLQSQDSIGCLVFERSFVILNATNTSDCTTVFMRDYGACDGRRNITVTAILEGRGENNITFRQPYLTITLAESGSTTTNINLEIQEYLTIASATTAALLLLVVISLVMIFIKCRSKKNISSNKETENANPNTDSNTMRSTQSFEVQGVTTESDV